MAAHAIKQDCRGEKKGVPMTKNSSKLQMWAWMLALSVLGLGTSAAFAQAPSAAAGSSVVSGQTGAPADITKLTGV